MLWFVVNIPLYWYRSPALAIHIQTVEGCISNLIHFNCYDISFHTKRRLFLPFDTWKAMRINFIMCTYIGTHHQLQPTNAVFRVSYAIHCVYTVHHVCPIRHTHTDAQNNNAIFCCCVCSTSKFITCFPHLVTIFEIKSARIEGGIENVDAMIISTYEESKITMCNGI